MSHVAFDRPYQQWSRSVLAKEICYRVHFLGVPNLGKVNKFSLIIKLKTLMLVLAKSVKRTILKDNFLTHMQVFNLNYLLSYKKYEI